MNFEEKQALQEQKRKKFPTFFVTVGATLI
jgi:hypothetical protein